MRILALLFTVVFSAYAIAAEDAQLEPAENIFHADLSHPDLAKIVTSFEQVCMPFILHKTELPHELNRVHMRTQLEDLGFEFEKADEVKGRHYVKTVDYGWKTTSFTGGIPISDNVKGKFTVFNGISEQVVDHSDTVLFKNSERDLRAIFPMRFEDIFLIDYFKTLDTEIISYKHRYDTRTKAKLEFNPMSQKYPAVTCAIKLETPIINVSGFTQNFIDKDEDWQPNETSWSQCVSDGEDKFFFTATATEEEITLDVTRNGFYVEDPCRNNSR